jgi:hypothetical protein
VPVEFLTDAQAATYGCYARPPSVADLDRCFLLDDKARGLIEPKRLPHTRLGYAVQLTGQRPGRWVGRSGCVGHPARLAARDRPDHRQDGGRCPEVIISDAGS